MNGYFQPPTEIRLAVIGLGYVGLSLIVESARHLSTVGFDINSVRSETLKDGDAKNITTPAPFREWLATNPCMEVMRDTDTDTILMDWLYTGELIA